MKIELKKVSFSERMSEETNAFVADVYVDGKNVGYAKNDGHGGNTDVRSYPKTRFEFDQCETWLKNQPQINIGTIEKPYMIDCNLETMVDHLLEQWLEDRNKKKLEKKMETSLMWGVPNSGRYTYVNFKVKLTQIPHNILQDKLNFYKKDFKEGVVFLNTNLVGFEL